MTGLRKEGLPRARHANMVHLFCSPQRADAGVLIKDSSGGVLILKSSAVAILRRTAQPTHYGFRLIDKRRRVARFTEEEEVYRIRRAIPTKPVKVFRPTA